MSTTKRLSSPTSCRLHLDAPNDPAWSRDEFIATPSRAACFVEHLCRPLPHSCLCRVYRPCAHRKLLPRQGHGVGHAELSPIRGIQCRQRSICPRLFRRRTAVLLQPLCLCTFLRPGPVRNVVAVDQFNTGSSAQRHSLAYLRACHLLMS